MTRAFVFRPLTNKQNTRRSEISRVLSTIVLLTSIVFCGRGRIATCIGGASHTPRAEFLGGLIGRKVSGRTTKGRFHTLFASALPVARHCSLISSPDKAPSSSSTSSQVTFATSLSNVNNIQTESCSDNTSRNMKVDLMASKKSHPNADSLWMYHVETTTSTMDEAKNIVGSIKHLDDEIDRSAYDYNTMMKPMTFVISASSQSHGRGTTQRNWKSSEKGNALFTIGLPLTSWMDGLKKKNNGELVPLTLLPLKVGSLVASHVQRILIECASHVGKDTQQKQMMPRVTVKWPNDVLIRTSSAQGIDSHSKIAGILIESSQDWFLIGIGINIGYAPTIPLEGVDYGRKATSISDFCPALNPKMKGSTEDGIVINEETDKNYWIQLSKKLSTDIAYDLHSWLHHPLSSKHSHNIHSGESILNQWRSYIDWDMELVLRDTPLRERVILKSILEDGRVVVQEVKTGVTRTLVSDYFL